MWSNEHTGIILCYRQHENVSVGDPKVFANLCYTTQQVSNTSLKIDVTFCVHLIVTKNKPYLYVILCNNCEKLYNGEMRIFTIVTILI